MKSIRELLESTSGVEIRPAEGSMEKEIAALVYDSRKIEKGSLFVAVKGAKFDGHSAIEEAAEKGAAAVLAETVNEEQRAACQKSGTAILLTKDSRQALGAVSAAWFDHPAKQLFTIGITGTKGKTTTTYLIKSILENAGIPCGLIGTIEADTGKEHIPAVNTTPESFLVQKYFAEMAKNGCKAVVMEVSSQALKMHRVSGIVFDVGVFTNFSEDHIGPNEHADMEEYLHCKSLLFRQSVHGIVNGDDANVQELLKENSCQSVESYGFGENCDCRASDVRLFRDNGALGVRFSLCGWQNSAGEKMEEVQAPFPGRFSVYNVLAALAVCRYFDLDVNAIEKGLAKAQVKGRIEMLPVSENYTLLIDYAHNAMALESLLLTLREYGNGRLLTLFGCGGNRSKSRRYEMGEVSGRLSDLSIITSDNPRDEEPMDIIADILQGMGKTQGKYVMIPDRKEAIAYAMKEAQPGDIVVLAGKGHEDYQEIRGVKHPMDERKLILEILEEKDERQAIRRMLERYPSLRGQE